MISELVAQLTRLLATHGDLWVYVGTRYAISFAETVDLLNNRLPGSILIEGEEDEDLRMMVDLREGT